MDFGDEDELDFEEDLPETKNINEVFENTEKEKFEDSDVNSYRCDQYLQIDCLEDEEDLLSKITSETEKPVKDTKSGTNFKTSVDEVNEKSEKKEEHKKVELEKNLKSNSFGKINKTKGKERPCGLPLYGPQGSARSNRRRPANNFMGLPRQNLGQRSNFLKGLPLRYPKLHHFSQNYFQNQNAFVSLLGTSTPQNQDIHQINNLFAHYSTPMLELRKNLIKNDVLGHCCNTIFSQYQFNGFSKCKGALEQNAIAVANNKNFPVDCMNGLKTNYDRENFNKKYCDLEQIADREKELVKSKKEARLIRFNNNQIFKKKIKSTENMSQRSITQSLDFEDEYFKKMDEQKRKRQEVFSLKEKNNHCHEKNVTGTLTVNKEFLLRKENPFENSFEMAGSNIKFEVKQKKRDKKATVNGSSLLEELCIIKKEVRSPVKFVRTVSKSFEELGLNKTKSEFFSNINDNETDICHGSNLNFKNVNKTSLVDTGSQTQIEPHLTGCIVKVFNIPSSTAADDILTLCSSVGIVREVKLNFPKENSVAIRFAEPKSAENFFKLCNGKVIDHHILNVITV